MPKAKKAIDMVQLEKLAMMQATTDEIAAWFEMTRRNWLARYAPMKEVIETIERGRGKGRVSLRRKQFDLAVNQGNVTMNIWLGKQLLGQKDIVINEHTEGVNNGEANDAKKRLLDKIASVVERRRTEDGDKPSQ